MLLKKIMVGIFCCFFLGNTYASISTDTLISHYRLPKAMKEQIEHYTVTQVIKNLRSFGALAHDPNNRMKTKVFAWGYEGWGGNIDDATKTEMDKFTVTQIYSNSGAFVALAHAPNNRKITKVFAWGRDDWGGNIDDAIKTEMDKFTVSQIYSNGYAFVALAHDSNNCNKTKVFAWGSEDWGGKINDKMILVHFDAWSGPNEKGQYSNYIGYDDNVQAASGIMERFGGGLHTAEEHAHIGTIDVIAGVACAANVVRALLEFKLNNKRMRMF